MKALVFEKPHHAVIKDVPYPKPGSGQVTIKVDTVGICGTDNHVYEGEISVPYPVIPGHEFSGTVYELGEGVTKWKVGDRVSADPNIFCGSCEYCLTDRGNHCENFQGIGTTLNGSIAEYIAVPSQNVIKIEDSMSFEEAAFIEPLACVVYGMQRLQLQVGDRVILFGAGAMGQQLVQAVAMAGASELVVVDVSAKKLDFALASGATKVFLSHEIKVSDFPKGFDVVVDVTGIPSVIEKAFSFLGPKGKFLQFGVTPQNTTIQIDSFQLYRKDWTILGSMAINHTFYPAYHWLREGRINVKPLISKVLTLEESIGYFSKPKNPDWFKIQIKL